jgi:tRNA threonylcarbamoyl adenosine modification protein YeaZ
MISLVLDTSTPRTSVGLFEDANQLFLDHHDGATAHAEALPLLVQRALKFSNEVSRVVVGMGPGPFTGLRVGIVFAQSFAHAREIPWYGICSLDAIEVDHDDYIVTTDARRKEVYWARYQSEIRVDGPHVSSSELLPKLSIPVMGFGVGEPLFPSIFKMFKLSSEQNIREPMYLRRPDAIPTSERR